jgi:hypothetical protein
LIAGLDRRVQSRSSIGITSVFHGLQHDGTGAMLQAMSNLFRTFCVLWMLLALPLQGMAQASMFGCHVNGTGGLAASGAHPINHAVMDHSGMDHSGMDHSSIGEDLGSQPMEQVLKATHACCNCAPSCAIVILSTDQVQFNPMQPPVVLPVSLSQANFSADTRRIDRPPKTHAI